MATTFTEGPVFAPGFRCGSGGKASPRLGASAGAVCSKELCLDRANRVGGGGIGGDVQSRVGLGYNSVRGTSRMIECEYRAVLAPLVSRNNCIP